MSSGQQHSSNCCRQDTAMNAEPSRWKLRAGVCAWPHNISLKVWAAEKDTVTLQLEKHEQRHLHPVPVLRVTCKWHLDTTHAVMPRGGPHLCAFLTKNVNFDLIKRAHHKPKGETFHCITDWSSSKVSRSQKEGERDPTNQTRGSHDDWMPCGVLDWTAEQKKDTSGKTAGIQTRLTVSHNTN